MTKRTTRLDVDLSFGAKRSRPWVSLRLESLKIWWRSVPNCLWSPFKGDVDQFYNGSRSQNLDLGSWTPGAKQTRPWAPMLFASSECTNSFTIWYLAMAVMFIDSILRMVIWNKTITSLIYNFGKEWWEFTLFYKTRKSFPLFSNWQPPNHVAILLQLSSKNVSFGLWSSILS